MRIASPYFLLLALLLTLGPRPDCWSSQKHSPQLGPRLSQSEKPAEIASVLKPEVLARILQRREVMTYADLADPKPELDSRPDGPSQERRKKIKPLREYKYYAGVEVRAPLEVTRSVIRNYSVYTQLVPYIDKAELNPLTQELQLEGGIWRYRIKSKIRFEEIGARWIRFQITQGHFLGMRGEFILEPRKDAQGIDSTLVLVRGLSEGRVFPPDWVVEQGAQVVFSLTGKKIRAYIEENKLKLAEEMNRSPIRAGSDPSGAAPQNSSQGGDVRHESTHPTQAELPKPKRRL
jgi:hypothetical protein